MVETVQIGEEGGVVVRVVEFREAHDHRRAQWPRRPDPTNPIFL